MGFDCSSPQHGLKPNSKEKNTQVVIWGDKFDRDTRTVMVILHSSSITFNLLNVKDDMDV